MREIVLDTETTGFDPKTGDRMVEIGAIELFNHMPTGKTYHQYINPERDMPQGAFEVHGLGPDLLIPPRAAEGPEVTLKDKPVFREIGQAFLDFIGDANLVPCDVEKVASGSVTAMLDGQRYTVPSMGIAKGAAQMVLRPHGLNLGSPDRAGLKGQITYAAYLGKEIQYTVDTDVGSLFVISPVQAQLFK